MQLKCGPEEDSEDHVNFAELSSDDLFLCYQQLDNSVKPFTQLELHVLFRAVSLVAVSFRRLHLRELFAAVTNSLMCARNASFDSAWDELIPHSDGLMRLCSGLLQTDSNGGIEFQQRTMGQFLFQYEILDRRVCHETMTNSCFEQLRSTNPRLVSCPWADISQSLLDLTDVSDINYARDNWPRHYKMVENHGDGLSSQLYELVELAVLSDHPKEQGYLNVEIRRMTLDTCLNLSLCHGLSSLESVCRRTGATDLPRYPVYGLTRDSQKNDSWWSRIWLFQELCLQSSQTLKYTDLEAETDDLGLSSLLDYEDSLESDDDWFFVKTDEGDPIAYISSQDYKQEVQSMATRFQQIRLDHHS
jgi:hypothetical protein